MRDANAAISASCVTITMVMPSRLSFCSKAIISRLVRESSAPVGSSADEPTGALDSRTSLEIMALLQKLNRDGMTIVMVTHEADIAAFASRILTFKDGRMISDLVNAPDDAVAILANAVDAANDKESAP